MTLVSGCVRTAIPEYSSELRAGEFGTSKGAGRRLSRLAAAEPLVLLRGPKAEDETIGHQYLMLFVPLTSLFFKNGVQDEIEEIALDHFTASGKLVFLAAERDRAAVVGAAAESTVVGVGLNETRVNAFDAFFFRALVIRGNLVLSVERPAEAPEQLETEVSDRTYRKFAYAPTLAYQFQKVLKNELSHLWKRSEEKRAFLGPRRSGRARLASGSSADSGRQLIFVLRPKLSGELPADFGQRVADSFGYPNALPYSPDAIMRMAQRGIAKGLPEETAHVEVSATDHETLLGALQEETAESSPWILRSNVEILGDLPEAKGRVLRLRARIEAYEKSANGVTRLFRNTCQIEHEIPLSQEGALVLALEQASAAISEVIFRGTKEAASVSCELTSDLET